MTPLIWIVIGIFIGFMLGIFIGASMCIRKVSEADFKYAVLRDRFAPLLKLAFGSENAPETDHEIDIYLEDPDEWFALLGDDNE